MRAFNIAALQSDCRNLLKAIVRGYSWTAYQSLGEIDDMELQLKIKEMGSDTFLL